MGFNTWDVGGCNCGCLWLGCRLPEADLHLVATYPGIGSQTVPMVYQGGCLWKGHYDLGAVHLDVTLGTITDTGCSYWASGSGFGHDAPAGCSGLVTSRDPPYLISLSCAPFNAYFSTSSTTPAAGNQWRFIP